jgi:hypothetical protein
MTSKSISRRISRSCRPRTAIPTPLRAARSERIALRSARLSAKEAAPLGRSWRGDRIWQPKSCARTTPPRHRYTAPELVGDPDEAVSILADSPTLVDANAGSVLPHRGMRCASSRAGGECTPRGWRSLVVSSTMLGIVFSWETPAVTKPEPALLAAGGSTAP